MNLNYKKFRISLVSVLMVLGTAFISSCTKEFENQYINDQMEISLETMEMTFLGNTPEAQTLHFKTNVNWLLRPTASWIKVETARGESGEYDVQISVEPNKSYEDRAARLNVMYGRSFKPIVIKQKEKLGVLLEENNFNLKKDAQSLNIKYAYNTDCKITIPAACTWVSLAPATKTMTDANVVFDIAANTTTDVREVDILFETPAVNLADTLHIRQYDASEITVPETLFKTNYKKQTVLVEVFANIPVDVIIPEEAAAWISRKDNVEADGKTYYSFELAENAKTPREAVITLKNEEKLITRQVTIRQEEFYNTAEFTLTHTDGLLELINSFSGDKNAVEKVTVNGAALSAEDLKNILRNFPHAYYLDIFDTETTTIPNRLWLRNNVIKKVILPKGLKELRENLFTLSTLEYVWIPNTIETFETCVFDKCAQLTTVDIQDGLKLIGNQAFSGTGLVEFTVPSSIEKWIGNAKNESKAFYNTADLKKIVFSEGITTMGAYMFAGSFVEEIYLPSTITKWEKLAGKKDSQSIIHCKALKKLYLADGLTNIGYNAFPAFTLQELYSYSKVPPVVEDGKLGDGMGKDNPGGTTIYVPSGSEEAYKNAPGWKQYARNIVGRDF